MVTILWDKRFWRGLVSGLDFFLGGGGGSLFGLIRTAGSLLYLNTLLQVRGAMAWWLAHWTPDREVRV